MSGAWLVLFIGLWLLCVVLVLLVLGLSRRIQSLESSTPLAELAAKVHADARAKVRQELLGAQRGQEAVKAGIVGPTGGMAGIVLFLNKQCGPCETFAADVAANLERHPGKGLAELLGARVTVVTDQAGAFDEFGVTAVIADPERAVVRDFAVTSTPTGIALDENGVVIEATITNQFYDLEELALASQPGRLEVMLPA
jgi:hypothetical protein